MSATLGSIVIGTVEKILLKETVNVLVPLKSFKIRQVKQ